VTFTGRTNCVYRYTRENTRRNETRDLEWVFGVGCGVGEMLYVPLVRDGFGAQTFLKFIVEICADFSAFCVPLLYRVVSYDTTRYERI